MPNGWGRSGKRRWPTSGLASAQAEGAVLSDNVGPHNTLAAQRKAYTALSTKTPTGLLAERARSNPQAANLNTLDELLLLGGGLPLQAQGQVIGAIGVAGAGGAEMDERCAQQAIDQVLGKTH